MGTASTPRGVISACAPQGTNNTEIGVLILMNALSNRVSVLLLALVKILTAALNVFAQEVTSWMIPGHSVLIPMSVMMILAVMTAARIVLALINVAALRVSSCTCISTSASTRTSVLILVTPVEAQSAPTLLEATTVAARMATNLTIGCRSVSKVRVDVTTHPALMAATQLVTKASAVTAQEGTRVLAMVTAWLQSTLHPTTVLVIVGTMRMSMRKATK